jgi:hypothetical protein
MRCNKCPGGEHWLRHRRDALFDVYRDFARKSGKFVIGQAQGHIDPVSVPLGVVTLLIVGKLQAGPAHRRPLCVGAGLLALGIVPDGTILARQAELQPRSSSQSDGHEEDGSDAQSCADVVH